MVGVVATAAIMKMTTIRIQVMTMKKTKMKTTMMTVDVPGTTKTKMIMTVAAVEEDPGEDLGACTGKKFEG